VTTECRICLVTYVHNEGSPDGHQMIREDCDFSPTTVATMRQLQLQITNQGTYSFLSLEDWGDLVRAAPHRVGAAGADASLLLTPRQSRGPVSQKPPDRAAGELLAALLTAMRRGGE
jgi:hypothetical protein